MKYRQIEAKLKALGCIEIPRRQEGSHREWRNPATGWGTTVPDWGGRDLKLGTIRAIVRQLGLDWSEFQRK